MMDNVTSLSYTGRDSVDIRRELVNLVPTLTDKWKDFSESDLGMVLIEVIAAAQDFQNFYFDNQAFETYLDTAEQPKNIRSILRAMNYRIPFTGSATGKVTVKFSSVLQSPYEIPKYTQFSSEDGSKTYAVYDNTIVPSGVDEYDVGIIEGEVRSMTVTKASLSSVTTIDGSISRRIYLNEPNLSDKSVWISQNGVVWTEVDDAILMYNGGRYFSVHQDSHGEAYVLMSVDFINQLPNDVNEEVTIYWLSSLGSGGYAEAGEVTGFVGLDGGVIESISNKEPISGGYDVQDPRDLKAIARLNNQTLGRYITLTDFETAVISEPYVFFSIVKDWKSPAYVSVPYLLKVWALDSNMNNLSDIHISTLKNKLYSKGITDLQIQYMITEFVDIEFDIELYLKISSESDQKTIRDLVRDNLTEMFDMENLGYGFSMSLAMLESSIRLMSNYIGSVKINSPRGDIVLDDVQFPRIAGFNITSVAESGVHVL